VAERDAIAEFSARAKKLGLTSGGSTSWYPVWRSQPPEGKEFWKDLSPFRQQIIDDLEFFWGEFGNKLDQLLAGSSS